MPYLSVRCHSPSCARTCARCAGVSVVAIHGHPHRRVAPPWRNTDPLRSSAAPPQALCRSAEEACRSSVEENRSLAERSYPSPGAALLLGGARGVLRGETLLLGGAMFVLRGAAQVLRGAGLPPRWSSTGPRWSSPGSERRERGRDPASRGSQSGVDDLGQLRLRDETQPRRLPLASPYSLRLSPTPGATRRHLPTNFVHMCTRWLTLEYPYWTFVAAGVGKDVASVMQSRLSQTTSRCRQSTV
ncbi:hypothetical protein FHW12_002932 [Dokdonella fugitiva]|uniref:Uncharacterized protein n=1 Tax=Dokdonella fugitiva TaxID=328517 RepID=A0A839F4G4_9GAMM|nr:hypothetical protein [Dokdonella fugitiva]